MIRYSPYVQCFVCPSHESGFYPIRARCGVQVFRKENLGRAYGKLYDEESLNMPAPSLITTIL